MQKLRICLAFCAVSILMDQIATAAPVSVSNPSFETPVAAPATFVGGTASAPSGWTVYNSGATNSDRFFGVWNPSTTNSFAGGAPNGANVGVVFLQNTTAIAEAGLRQALAATLQLSTQYTLSVGVGNFSDADPGPFNFTGFPGYRVELFAGATLLASDNNTLTPAEGIFATSTVSFTTGSSHANSGQALAIRLVNLNGPGTEVNFDDVRLDAVAVVCGDGVTNGTEACDLGAAAACTGLGTPFACCSGVGTGACNGASGRCCSGACAFSSDSCRAVAGVCDTAEFCTGVSLNCPVDSFVSAATQCRAAAGVCDVAESCTGTDAACPADAVAASTTECRVSVGVCDLSENCDGVAPSCPGDALANNATQCRAAAGVCDVAENCTGTDAACPADAFAASTTECRASAGDCDVAEHCDVAGSCPADVLAAPLTPCGSSNDTTCDNPDSCDGLGACNVNNESAATPCRAIATACDAAENCDGAGGCPADASAADTTPCNDDNACTTGESCGLGVCSGGTLSACDDGNLCTADSCDEISGCVNSEELLDPGSCFIAGKFLFQVEDRGSSARNSMKWSWARGAAVDPLDLGTPATTTDYALCIFDHTAALPTLAASYQIPASSLWSTKPESIKYVDREGAADGVRLLKARAKLGAGKSRVALMLSGANLTLPFPASGDLYFNLDATLTVQLRNSDDACWSSDFTPLHVRKNTATSFIATGP